MRITNKLGLPTSIVKALESDYQYKPYQFSATTILQGIKSFLLMKRHSNEIEMDASEGLNMLLGTAVHNLLEGHATDEELAEDYMKVKVPNTFYSVSGKYDLFNLETKELTDYKTCTIWKIKFKDFDDWKKQLLIYAWMLKQLGIEVKKARITAWIKDYSKSDYKLAILKNEYYPEAAIINIDFNFTENDFIEIEKWIIDRFNKIQNSEYLGDDDIPICSEEERWYSGTKYAVMKNGNIKAIKLFNTEQEANDFAATNKDYYVVERKGIDRKCVDYCNACKFCNYYKEHYGGNENV